MSRLSGMLVCVLALVSGGVFAEEQVSPTVTVKWEEPKSFVDIRSAIEPQKRFEKQVFNALSDFIKEKAAGTLAEGHELKVVIYDLDLAGHIEMNFLTPGQNMRVVRDSDLVMIEIGHTLVGDAGQVISADRRTFSGPQSHFLKSKAKEGRAFYYEKELIRDWLKTVER